jgi:imidazoleglycerol phosphate synthase glutamine amidotransferase subunit HisH
MQMYINFPGVGAFDEAIRNIKSQKTLDTILNQSSYEFIRNQST